MGRKIPGKKHRSIVDPERQRAKRMESLKDKINNPPQNPNEQEVPRSLLTIMKLKKEAKENYKGKSRRKISKRRKLKKLLSVEQFLDKEKIQPGMRKPEKFVPKLVQRPGETPEHFYHRVNSMTQKIIKEAQFEDKFDVTIKKDAETGKVLDVEKNPKRKSSKHLSESGKKTLSQKRKEKKMNKVSEKDEKDFSHLKDIVEFGEIIHRPPNTSSLLKKLKPHSIFQKKDKYKDLLLQNILKNYNNQEERVRQK